MIAQIGRKLALFRWKYKNNGRCDGVYKNNGRCDGVYKKQPIKVDDVNLQQYYKIMAEQKKGNSSNGAIFGFYPQIR